MSHEIPVFSFPVSADRLRSGMEIDEVLNLAPPDLWMATSRNWWYQGLLASVLEVYPGRAKVDFLLKDLVWIPPGATLSLAQSIRALLSEISAHPQAFCAIYYDEETPESVRQQVSEAQVLRQLDDDCIHACANFFSFLVSQAAALEEASQLGLGLVYVQPQPSRSEAQLSLEFLG